MNYSFETQGPVTYLVGEVEPKEVIDSLTMGMLSNNHIVGFAPVLYTELDGRRFLKYNISAKLTAAQFFSGNITPMRAIEGFKNILNAICMADDYMIDSSCFDFNADRVFINISSCEVAMICVPVIKTQNVNAEVINLFKLLLNSSGLYDSPDMAKIKAYIEMPETFNIYNLKNIVDTWTPGVSAPVASSASTFKAPSKAGAPESSQLNVQQDNSTGYVRPVLNNGFSSQPGQPQNQLDFGGTISMDQAPKFFGGTSAASTVNSSFSFGGSKDDNKKPQNKAPVQPSFGPSSANASRPIKPPIIPSRPTSASAGTLNKPGVGESKPIPGVKPQMPNDNRMAPQNGQPGIAIPGRSQMPGSMPQPVSATEEKPSFFKKLFHRNKDNNAKSNDNKEQKKLIHGGVPRPEPSPINRPPVPIQNIRQDVYNGKQPIREPYVQNRPVAPISNSFNETTVLSPMSGETTVLDSGNEIVGPHLTRIKTGEKISINKPVFRIGKERSYVDYFITDNTAISRSHANIITAGNEYFIEDTNSTNHTFVNGKMVNANEKIKLSNGDNIRLANEEFCFSY